MRYPIAIEPGDDTHAFGVVVPDLPGCFSAGDSLDEAFTNAEEAILLWIDYAMDAGTPIPKPAPLEQHRRDPDFRGWIWGMVSIDLSRLEKVERVNISLPHRVLKIIDNAAEQQGESRSSFLAHAALTHAQTIKGHAAAAMRKKPSIKKKATDAKKMRAHAKKRA